MEFEPVEADEWAWNCEGQFALYLFSSECFKFTLCVPISVDLECMGLHLMLQDGFVTPRG